jgi:hypothetical protein
VSAYLLCVPRACGGLESRDSSKGLSALADAAKKDVIHG